MRRGEDPPDHRGQATAQRGHPRSISGNMNYRFEVGITMFIRKTNLMSQVSKLPLILGTNSGAKKPVLEGFSDSSNIKKESLN